MANNKLTNEELINYALTGSAWPKWEDITPDAKAYYDTRKQLMLADNTQGRNIRNEIWNDIINKVGITRVKDARLTNPFAFMREEAMPFGDFIEDIIVAPAIGQAYNPAGNDYAGADNPFNTITPSIKAVYTQINSAIRYSAGWKAIELMKGFNNASGMEFEQVLSQFVGTMDSGATRDEYTFSKQLINTAILAEPHALLPNPDQFVELPYDIRDFKVTADQVATCIAIMEDGLSDLQYNSAGLNAGGVERAVDASLITMMMNKKAAIAQGVKALAYAYNPEFQELGVPTYQYENLGTGLEGVIAIAAEQGTFTTHIKEHEFDGIHNPANGRENYFLRIQQLFRYCPYGAMRIFVAPGTRDGLIKKVAANQAAIKAGVDVVDNSAKTK